MPTLLFDMQSGVAGDMVLAGLFDLGVDFGTWEAEIGKLNAPELRVKPLKVRKQGLSATWMEISLPHEHHHRHLSHIRQIITKAGFSPWVERTSIAIFTRLAEAEAEVHGMSVEQVHFHEVGAWDAIVDVVGACIGFELLGVDSFRTTPFTFGAGTVETEHGRMPIPVPATLALTRGFPSIRTGLPFELCTPTGAAIVTTLATPIGSGELATVMAVGVGAGTRDIPGIPNVLRLCLLDTSIQSANDGEFAIEDDVLQVECNLDDQIPETLAYASDRLFNAGALDVWQEPIFMKKNRCAVKLCVLVQQDRLKGILTCFAMETSTGGVRWSPVRRMVAQKGDGIIETGFGSARYKTLEFKGIAGGKRGVPEYESCRELAERTGTPLLRIYADVAAHLREKGL